MKDVPKVVEFTQEVPDVKDSAQGRELTAPDFMTAWPLEKWAVLGVALSGLFDRVAKGLLMGQHCSVHDKELAPENLEIDSSRVCQLCILRRS
jgi:hypothetical protein